MSNFLKRSAEALASLAGKGTFHVTCSQVTSEPLSSGLYCDLEETYASETAAKLAGWWFDTRKGWLCPSHNLEHDTQTDLPFATRSLTPEDQREITKYLDVKDDGSNEPVDE